MNNEILKQLEYIKLLVDELQSTNLANEKKNILTKYYTINQELFSVFFDHVYSFDKKYWLTSTNVLKLWDKFNQQKYDFINYDNLFVVLAALINRQFTGHNAINYIIDFIKKYKSYMKYIFYIIDKDIKANANTSLINKVHSCIKEFNVALANRYDEAITSNKHQVDFSKQNWMISRKLDGVRTIAINNHGKIEFYSRQGERFHTLEVLAEQVLKIMERLPDLCVFDGEVCIIDENGQDNFAAIMKQITRKNHQIKDLNYVLFDLIDQRDFYFKKGTTSFRERLKNLTSLKIESKIISIVEHECDINQKQFDEWKNKAVVNKWEGLILRDLNSIYQGKRSFDILKVKMFQDNEYVVKSVIIGKKKMLDEKSNLMVEQTCVKAITIEHKGCIVAVGSGISDYERLLWLDEKLIIGKTVTIQFFDELYDEKNQTYSLRFPTLKYVYDDKRLT